MKQAADSGTSIFSGWYRDTSTWVLLAVNLATLAFGIWLDWRLAETLLVYWSQSLFIGMAYLWRLLALGDGYLESDDGQRISVRLLALVFPLHYGAFLGVHVFYIFKEFEPAVSLGLVVAIIAFGINHLYSLRAHLESERQDESFAALFALLPYLRVVPMHAMITIGAALTAYVAPAVLLTFFVLMKTIADVGMHVVEHAMLNAEEDPSEHGAEDVPTR